MDKLVSVLLSAHYQNRMNFLLLIKVHGLVFKISNNLELHFTLEICYLK